MVHASRQPSPVSHTLAGNIRRTNAPQTAHPIRKKLTESYSIWPRIKSIQWEHRRACPLHGLRPIGSPASARDPGAMATAASRLAASASRSMSAGRTRHRPCPPQSAATRPLRPLTRTPPRRSTCWTRTAG